MEVEGDEKFYGFISNILLDNPFSFNFKEKGLSNRSVAKSLGIDKKTVNKYWNEYKENLSKLDNETNSTNILRIQEDIVSKPKYNSVSRVRRKLTPDFF